MTQRIARRPTLDRSEYLEMALRIMGGGLTIGLLIVLPALRSWDGHSLFADLMIPQAICRQQILSPEPPSNGDRL